MRGTQKRETMSDESAGRTLGVQTIFLYMYVVTGYMDFWPREASGHLDNGHSDFWSSGHLDFWPSFSMPKKCPNWDILDLPCCYTNLEFLTFSLESKTTNMLLPTFHAQFSRETTKPKTQPGRLAASWHIWYSFLSSRLQKDCFFLFLLFFFHCILVYLERMGQFFKCLITLWWYSLVWKQYSPQHRVWYKKIVVYTQTLKMKRKL